MPAPIGAGRRRATIAPACALLAAGILLAATAGSALAKSTRTPTPTPTVAPQQQISGSSTAQGIDALGGLALAHDGTGGVVFLQDFGGAAHVFVSRLRQGVFQPAEQVDATLAGPAAQAQIAADASDQLVVVFISSGALYATENNGPNGTFSTPEELAPAASNPSLSMNRYGDGYCAFTAPDGTGDDVDVVYYEAGVGWLPASPEIFNRTPGDDAGVGDNRPSVVAAGDGVGIVTWGEGSHVYARRVWGTQTSVQTTQLDAGSVDGDPEISADEPEVAAGGDSSYVDIAFREQVENAAAPAGVQTRVMLGRLIAETSPAAVPIDGLSGGTGVTADQPEVSMGEFGNGFASATTDGGQLVVTTLGTNGEIESATNLPAVTGVDTSPEPPSISPTMIAWQAPDGSGNPQIVESYSTDGATLAPPTTIASGITIPANALTGLETGVDGNGDGMIVWASGQEGSLTLNSEELSVPPTAVTPSVPETYVNTATPQLTWPASHEAWGPVTYSVTLDGTSVGQTQTTSFTPTTPLTDGPHTWSVTATDAAGAQVAGTPATVFVDTTKPTLQVSVSGSPHSGAPVTVQNVYTDPVNPAQPGSTASGIASVSVNWGDDSPTVTAPTLPTATHTYAQPGPYTITVTAADEAGNVATFTQILKVATAKPQRKRRAHPATAAGGHHPAKVKHRSAKTKQGHTR